MDHSVTTPSAPVSTEVYGSGPGKRSEEDQSPVDRRESSLVKP